ncbi:EthD family reductase [Paenarthrobacter sp. NPDC090520]|uniref:EthD family reductase n=1 Tax=Paenarthrobacter sp. NPDC090520 TaxID=3364382 RepID=UPI003803F1AC
MKSLFVLYGAPKDPTAFSSYYKNTHLPLTRDLPEMLSSEFALELHSPGGAPSETFAYFRADFDDADALGAALASPQGTAVAQDVANYATGGAVVLVGETAKFDRASAAVEAYLAAWNAHDIDAILSFFAVGGRYSDPVTNTAIGGDELRVHLSALFSAIPDLHLEPVTVQSNGRTGVAFWEATGGAGALRFFGSDILQFDAMGLIDWTIALYDQENLKSQLQSVSKEESR